MRAEGRRQRRERRGDGSGRGEGPNTVQHFNFTIETSFSWKHITIGHQVELSVPERPPGWKRGLGDERKIGRVAAAAPPRRRRGRDCAVAAMRYAYGRMCRQRVHGPFYLPPLTMALAAAAYAGSARCDRRQPPGQHAPAAAGLAGQAKAQGAQRALVSVQAAQGLRPYMEDENFVSRDGTFVGVYDGHGGSRVSSYLRKTLHVRMAEMAKKKGGRQGAEAPVEDIAWALKAAFDKVDAEVLRDAGMAIEGSTAAVIVLSHTPTAGAELGEAEEEDDGEQRYIVAGNVGDSRAVLSRRGRAIDLTRDHKPNSPEERRRIEALGGRVKWFGYYDTEGKPVEGTGVWRVNGNLAVARAFGDRFERPYVSGECDVGIWEMEPKEDQFIIVASDGLWDVMSSDEAVKYVHNVMAGSVGALREGTSAFSDRPVDVDLQQWRSKYRDDRGLIRAALLSRKRKMAKYLVEEALRRGSSDNVTTVVVWLA